MDQNFSTKYRPLKFADVVGQDIPKTVLKKVAAAQGIAVRSIFLKGAYGSGKSTLCRIFARAMNCEHFKETGDVCNECDSCKEVMASNSQLYFEFDSSVAGNVDAIRSLQDKLAYQPKGRRVIVFDETQAASKAALNALLKMVEDGIPNTIFVFASTEDILPTIKSRSLCLDISVIPHAQIKDRLKIICEKENIAVNENDLDMIATKSNGHMRDALSILQLYSLVGTSALKSAYMSIYKFFQAAFSKNFQVALDSLNEILKFNTLEIKNSLYLFVKNSFVDSTDNFFKTLSANGTANKLFNLVFNPVNQFALKDEMGVELFFRAFLQKLGYGQRV